MKDKIVFFILGALLATLAYFVGDLNLSAHNPEIGEVQIIPELLVKELWAESIKVGFSDTHRIHLWVNEDLAKIDVFSDDQKKRVALIVTKETGIDGAFIAIRDDTGKTRALNADGIDRFREE